MLLLNLISPDAALRHAICEQLRVDGGWEVAEFASLAAARGAESQAAIIDAPAFDTGDAFSHTGNPPLLFTIGDTGGKIDAASVTENFPKPLRLGYLLARLQFYRRAILRPRDIEYSLGSCRFAPRSKKLTVAASGEVLRLTDKESGLLDFLCQAAQPVPRGELLAAVWGYDGDIDTHTLETHITRLRRLVPNGQDLFRVENGCYRINPAWLAGA